MSDAADAGAGQTDERRVILKVTVEVSADHSDTILVHEGDDPRDLAAQFCEKHGLQESLIGPLTSHVSENLKKIADGDGSLGTKEAGRRTSEERPSTPNKVAGKITPRPTRSDASTPNRRRSSSLGRSATSGMPRPSSAGASYASAQPSSARGSQDRSVASHAEPAGSVGGRASTPGRTGVRQPRTPSGATPRGSDAGTPASAIGSLPGAAARSGSPGNTEARVNAGPLSTSSPIFQLQITETKACRADDGANRFERLHEDANQRRARADRLRKQVEQDIQDQLSRTTSPGGVRSGDRLYRDAEQRQARLKQIQNLVAEQKRVEELDGATFVPAIEASQRKWRGVGRSMRDPEGLKTRKKIDHMREMKQKSALDGCTFHPEIDPKSEQLMSQRIARFRITGSLYDHLYEDAQRRQERQVEFEKVLPAGVTFQPDIGIDHMRPPNDDNREDMVNRLAYSKSYSERWLSMRRQQEDGISQESNSHAEFHPQTGRGPNTQRNKAGLPIGEFLYEHSKEKALRSQAEAEEADRERSQSSAPKVGTASRQLLEESKRRKYKDLYESLASDDPQKRLCYSTLSLHGLDEELIDFLRPMTAYLKETNSIWDFESFCTALDYQRQHSSTPTAHLFVQKSRPRTSDRYRQEVDGEVFTPRIDPHSSRIASRHRPRGSTPLHEQLLREKEVWDSKLQEQREIQEERELEECTFQPNSLVRSSSSERGLASGGQPRAIRLGGVVLMDQDVRLTDMQIEEPRTIANPVAKIINSLESTRDRAFVEGILQSFAPEAVSLDPCKAQIAEAEQTVAQCKTLLVGTAGPSTENG